MATTPQPPPKPQTPPQPPKPPEPKPEAAKARAADPALPIGAKPVNPNDPQAIKYDPPQPAPPKWEDDPQPKPIQIDGQPVADEQRERSAVIEKEGVEKWLEKLDQRSAEDRPKFDRHALAGGGAYISAGAQKQVAGVTPPTKRE